MSKANQFKSGIQPTRRDSYTTVIARLEQSDPELLAAITEALSETHASLAAIHRSIREVGIDIGYSALVRWRDYVRG